MCKLQEPPFEMDIVVSSNVEDIMALAPKPKVKKTKKPKKKTPTTGMEVIETLEEINPEEPGYTPQEIDAIVKTSNEFKFPYKALPEPTLPSYEDMMNDIFGPSSMETQPDLYMPVNLEQVARQEYMMDASKPLHTNFLLPNQGLALCYSCPVFFGSIYEKEMVAESLCNEIHPKIQQEWGTFSCRCGLIPSLRLSHPSKNPNSVPGMFQDPRSKMQLFSVDA